MPNQKSKKLLPNLILWEAPEFQEHKRSPHWYLGAGILAFALLAFAIYSQSLLTIITFALIIALGLAFAYKKPQKLIHRITTNDISVGSTIYPYKNIKQFWIIYSPPEVKTLNFETTGYLNSLVSLQLGDQDPVEVKLMLSKFLPEDLDREESLTDVIARKAKF